MALEGIRTIHISSCKKILPKQDKRYTFRVWQGNQLQSRLDSEDTENVSMLSKPIQIYCWYSFATCDLCELNSMSAPQNNTSLFLTSGLSCTNNSCQHKPCLQLRGRTPSTMLAWSACLFQDRIRNGKPRPFYTCSSHGRTAFHSLEWVKTERIISL